MDEIVRLIDAGQSQIETFRSKNVAGHHLRARGDAWTEVLGTAREATEVISV
jgi:hypothetical protein